MVTYCFCNGQPHHRRSALIHFNFNYWLTTSTVYCPLPSLCMMNILIFVVSHHLTTDDRELAVILPALTESRHSCIWLLKVDCCICSNYNRQHSWALESRLFQLFITLFFAQASHTLQVHMLCGTLHNVPQSYSLIWAAGCCWSDTQLVSQLLILATTTSANHEPDGACL